MPPQIFLSGVWQFYAAYLDYMPRTPILRRLQRLYAAKKKFGAAKLVFFGPDAKSQARLPWDRRRLAGLLGTLGRRPGLLAGLRQLPGFSGKTRL